MTQTPRLQQATNRVRGSFAQSLLRFFLHDERNQGVGSHSMPKGRDWTRKGQSKFAGLFLAYSLGLRLGLRDWPFGLPLGCAARAVDSVCAAQTKLGRNSG
jgi:hypothetical protein